LKELITNKIKGIVFDLDGTLIDSKNDILSAFSYAFENLKAKKPPDEVLIHTIGARLEECFKPFLGDDENLLKEAARLFRIHYESHFLDKTKPFEGVEDLLKELKDRFSLAVVTMKKGYYARKVINNFGWDKYFKCIVGAEEGLKAKPDPEMLNKAVSNLALKKEEIVYVGDTVVDLMTAKNCGVKFIYVKWGYGSLDGAFENTLTANTPSEVASLIKKMV
jgi:phosphoglycolate phosphatase